MNNFYIDVTSINNKISILKSNLENYSNKIIEIISNLKKFDTCWNDINTNVFMSFVEEDELIYNDHVKAINEYIQFIQDFCVSLNNVVSQINDSESLQSIKYVKNYVDVSIEALNNIMEGITNAYNIYSSIRIPVNTKTYYDITSLMNNISKNVIITVKEQILETKNGIANLLNEMRNEISSITFVELDNNVCTIERTVA